ncbi:MAG: hypothetical protein L3K23_00960 [Thermoplasmata archaeon]|nr:hypothetical protein [Thermoplasmata archaeon]
MVLLMVVAWPSLASPLTHTSQGTEVAHLSAASSPLAAASASLLSGHGPAAGASVLCSAASSGTATCAASALSPHPSAGGAENWVHLTSLVGPSSRWIAMMAYDPVDQYAVYFGGLSPSQTTTYGDTWVYSNGLWTNLTGNLTNSPTSRYAANFGWDAKDGYLVLFGGRQYPNTYYNDTWEFLHGAWTPLSPNTAPSPRWRAAMTWDVNDSYLLLFGGSGMTTGNISQQIIFNDTWSFVGGQWTNLTANTSGHPLPRYRANMAYDVVGKHAVLFGGCTDLTCAASSTETWIYNNLTWTDRTSSLSTHPSGRVYYGFTYDSEIKAALLFGGATSTASGALGDTWLFSNGTWSSLTLTTRPSARGYETLADDTGDGYVLLYGGYDYTTFYADTWSFGPAIVTALHALPPTLDSGQNLSVGAGAWPVSSSDSFAYAGLPPGCASANVTSITCVPTTAGTYPIEGFVNLTGGASYTRNVTIAVNPPPQISLFTVVPSALTLGTSTNLTVTALPGTAPLSYGYSGLPAGCNGANLSVINCRPSVYGTFTAHAVVRDVVGEASYANVTFVVYPRPHVAGFTSSRPSVDVGQRVTFLANETGGTPPISYVYTGLPSGCASANTDQLSCRPGAPGIFVVTVNASDAFGVYNRSSVILSVAADPAVLGLAFGPDKVDLGVTTTLNFTVVNGTGAYTFAYRGLPPGCSITGGSGNTCQATSAGTFTVTVMVTDGAGFVVNATTTLVVSPVPSISSFNVGPTVVDTGQNVSFNVTGAGGTAPLHYSYTQLPAGCVGATTAGFVCRPTEKGTFAISVTVTDLFRLTATGSATLIVHAAPSVTTFAASPSPVVVGATTAISVTVTGGTGVLSFVYAGLPTGCASANASSLSCVPKAAGSFALSVTVTDQLGASTQSNATLVVSPTPPSSSSGGGSPFGSPYLLLGIVLAVVVAGVVVLLVVRRRGGGRAPPAPSNEPTQEEPEWAESPEPAQD